MAPAPGHPDAGERLIRLAIGGDEAAFARIVRLHNEAMQRAAFAACGDADLALAAVARSWPIAWTRLRRLRDPDRLLPWLCEIAVGEALSAGGVVPRHATAPPAEPPPADDDAGAAGYGRAADPGLADALALLGPRERAALALRHVGGLDGIEAARASGTPTANAEARLMTLLRRIRAADVGPPVEPEPEPAPELGPRMRAYAAVPVRPVDVDAVARNAHADALVTRNHHVSVLVAGFFAALVVAALYLVTIDSTGSERLASPSPTSLAAHGEALVPDRVDWVPPVR